MITYAGLARLLAIAAGVLSGKLPPGHLAIRTLGAVLAELRVLTAQDPLTGSPVVRRAFGLGNRGLWRHGCGNAGLGAPVTDVPPGYCEQCNQTGGWERLYVNASDHPE